MFQRLTSRSSDALSPSVAGLLEVIDEHGMLTEKSRLLTLH